MQKRRSMVVGGGRKQREPWNFNKTSSTNRHQMRSNASFQLERRSALRMNSLAICKGDNLKNEATLIDSPQAGTNAALSTALPKQGSGRRKCHSCSVQFNSSSCNAMLQYCHIGILTLSHCIQAPICKLSPTQISMQKYEVTNMSSSKSWTRWLLKETGETFFLN